MKGKNTISTFELFELFPDQEAARIYLEGRLWPEGQLHTSWDRPSRYVVAKEKGAAQPATPIPGPGRPPGYH